MHSWLAPNFNFVPLYPYELYDQINLLGPIQIHSIKNISIYTQYSVYCVYKFYIHSNTVYIKFIVLCIIHIYFIDSRTAGYGGAPWLVGGIICY